MVHRADGACESWGHPLQFYSFDVLRAMDEFYKNPKGDFGDVHWLIGSEVGGRNERVCIYLLQR